MNYGISNWYIQIHWSKLGRSFVQCFFNMGTEEIKHDRLKRIKFAV